MRLILGRDTTVTLLSLNPWSNVYFSITLQLLSNLSLLLYVYMFLATIIPELSYSLNASVIVYFS